MDNEVLQMYDPFYEQVKSDKWLSLFFCPNILRVLTYAPHLFPRHSDTRPPCAMPQDELATEAGEAEEAAEGQGFSQGRQHPPPCWLPACSQQGAGSRPSQAPEHSFPLSIATDLREDEGSIGGGVSAESTPPSLEFSGL